MFDQFWLVGVSNGYSSAENERKTSFFVLLVWFRFFCWLGLTPVSLTFFVFCPLVALGNLFLVADVAGCLVLLAAGLFCGPGCLDGGLLIDGAGLGWFGLVVCCSLLGWQFGSAFLALLAGVTCQ